MEKMGTDRTLIPDNALCFGFVNQPTIPHASRTMLLADARLLFATCPPDATAAEYRAAIVHDNVLMKATMSNRRITERRLREFYTLDRKFVLFRALRSLWDSDASAQPLLALLCVTARDAVFRATIDLVLSLPEGAAVSPMMAEVTVSTAFPDRYSAKTLKSIGQHILGTWQQSGHLSGTVVKRRGRATPTPAATAYALLLGYLCGARGLGLFETLWARLLDASPAEIDSLAFAASQRGWLDYRRVGNVVQIAFPTYTDATTEAGRG